MKINKLLIGIVLFFVLPLICFAIYSAGKIKGRNEMFESLKIQFKEKLNIDLVDGGIKNKLTNKE